MPALVPLRLGVNIDHVATVRNARGGKLPDPLRAAAIAAAAGADGITAHLREDRRHIVDADIDGLMRELKIPLNFEMAATPEMVGIALKHRPHAACIVPEKREERTTEGGLDAAGQHNHLKPMVAKIRDAGIRVSLFIEADPRQLEAAVTLGAPVVELHTGRYCELEGVAHQAELARLHALPPQLAGEPGGFAQQEGERGFGVGLVLRKRGATGKGRAILDLQRQRLIPLPVRKQPQ
ncbi:MAG: pyridoxine 5'-phosphate synthase, partial [Enhydrobacter sp.]